MFKRIKQNVGVGLKGVHIATLADLRTEEAWKIHQQLVELERSHREPEFSELLKWFNQRFAVRVAEIHNVTPTEGRTILAQALSGQLATIAETQINYVALGTGSNAPAISDTQLQTETFRKQYSSRTYADNIAYITAFYASTDTNGTFQEHGLFINGSGTANSGAIISRLLLGGLAKTALQTLTIESSLTLSDA